MAGCFIAVGIFMVAVVFIEGYSFQTDYSLGAGFVPFFLGLIQIVLGGLIIFQTVHGAYDGDKNKMPNRAGMIRIILLILFCAAGTLAMKWLGMLITICVLFLLITRFVCEQPWLRSLRGAVIATVFFYLLFAVGFSVRFPVGVLGI